MALSSEERYSAFEQLGPVNYLLEKRFQKFLLKK